MLIMQTRHTFPYCCGVRERPTTKAVQMFVSMLISGLIGYKTQSQTNACPSHSHSPIHNPILVQLPHMERSLDWLRPWAMPECVKRRCLIGSQSRPKQRPQSALNLRPPRYAIKLAYMADGRETTQLRGERLSWSTCTPEVKVQLKVQVERAT